MSSFLLWKVKLIKVGALPKYDGTFVGKTHCFIILVMLYRNTLLTNCGNQFNSIEMILFFMEKH